MTIRVISPSVPTVPTVPIVPSVPTTPTVTEGEARIIVERTVKWIVAPSTCKTSVAVIWIHKRGNKTSVSKTEGVVVVVAIPKR
jgi:hypothetical protein